MLNYREFCDKNAFDKEGKNRDAMQVFDFLCHAETIHSMMVFSGVGLPAFSGIAKDLEKNFADVPNFPLRERSNRQVAGKMVKYILAHFGYEPLQERTKKDDKLRKFSQAELFRQSAVYAKTGRESLELRMTVRRIGIMPGMPGKQ